ncbi:MAG: MarR family transcriptional regulator [Alphaproteobacteria bacterium]
MSDQATAQAGKLKLGTFLPYRLASCGALVSAAFAREYGGRFGVSLAEWRVMAILGETAPLSSRDLVAATFMDKAKVSRAVSSMEAAGLLDRAPHATDNRLLELSLTDKGRSVHAEIAALALEWEADLISALPEGTAEALIEALVKIEQAVEPEEE